MRRLIVLLLAAGLLAFHHGAPMSDAMSGMAGNHSGVPSAGIALLCVGVIAAAADILRRLAMRLRGQRALPGIPARLNSPAGNRAAAARGQPPPRAPALALLCVNQR